MSLSLRQQVQFWLIAIVIFFVLLYFLRGMLTPFVAGMAVAYFLDPMCDRLEKLGLGRTLATTILTVGFALVFIGLLLILVPTIISQLAGFIGKLPDYLEALRGQVAGFLNMVEARINPDLLAKLKASLSSSLDQFVTWITHAAGRVITGGLALVNFLSLVIITPVVAFYLLRDWDKMVNSIDRCLPRDYAEVIRQQLRLVDQTLAGFVRGQSTVCIVLGTYYALALSLAGLDFGLLIGSLAGLLTFIPYVGSATGLVASIGTALVQFDDPIRVGIVAVIFFAGQIVEGNYLTPKLVGGQVGLHAVWVIFALMAGGFLFGFVGVMLAVPVAAVIGVLVRFFLQLYMESPYYWGTSARQQKSEGGSASGEQP